MEPKNWCLVAASPFPRGYSGSMLLFQRCTLQGTNISPKNGILEMIFLFPRWDMLIPWRVIPLYTLNNQGFFSLLTCFLFFSSPCLPGRGSASSAADTMVVGAPGGENGGSWRANIVSIYTPPTPINGWFRCIFLLPLWTSWILWGVRVPPTATPKK